MSVRGLAITKHTAVQWHETVKTELVLPCPTYMCDTVQGRSALPQSRGVFGLVWFASVDTSEEHSRAGMQWCGSTLCALPGKLVDTAGAKPV